jgi:diaminopimelate decarboxylase
LGFARHLAQLGLGVDVASRGELIVARRAGFPSMQVHLHGNNKSRQELENALRWGLQAIVVDSLEELDLLEEIAAHQAIPARVWLRVNPNVDVDTHPYRRTALASSKFGLPIEDGQAAQAIRRLSSSSWLELTGLHCHIGSQIFDPGPYRRAIEIVFALARAENFAPRDFSPGGGWGVRYTTADPPDDPEPWVEAISAAVVEQCRRLDWPLPRLVLEPGRWLVARAGVALYSVGAIKTALDGTRIVAIDGGMADNIRPALYQAGYTALAAARPEAPSAGKATLVGKFCESGDVLIPEVELPDLKRDDVLAVPVSGAYQLSMASNYNLAARPAVLWLDNGITKIIQERELAENSDWWVAAG